MIKKWLRALMGGAKAPPAVKPRPKSLSLEVLEDRCVPAALAVQSYSADQLPSVLSKVLSGNGIQISNVAYSGSAAAAGTFSNGSNAVGLSQGIILDTGAIVNVPGNLTTAANPPVGTSLGQAGNGDLTAILPAGSATQDAATLTFNFVSQGPLVTMNFVFASNEYAAVNTANLGTLDTFAAFINGRNTALINNVAGNRVNPSTILTQNVNRINDPRATGNPSPLDVQFDQVTRVLTIVAEVVPGQTNTMELVIADVGAGAGNTVGDSAVFIQAQGLSAGPRLTANFPARYAYNFASNTFDGYLTIQNIGTLALPRTFANPVTGTTDTAGIAFPVLPPGVTITSSIPFVINSLGQRYIPLPAQLQPGQFMSIPIKVSNPLRQPLPTFFSGQLLNVRYFAP